MMDHMSTEFLTGKNDKFITIIGTGGTIDKDYPRSQMGYAFEIDEPAAQRVLEGLPHSGMEFEVVSVCKKDSTEITADDRNQLADAVRRAKGSRVVVTHGTDTMIESAKFVLAKGAADGKTVAFTGAMKPERFKDSDAHFNLGMAVAATSLQKPGTVVVCMGGRAIDCSKASRTADGFFV